MKNLSLPRLLIVFGTVVLIVLLFLAPRIPGEISETNENDIKGSVQERINKAVSLVKSQQPMQGIMMLREILEEDSSRIDAHWHLAFFSVESGQLDKAIYRFNRVLELDDEKYIDAHYHLANIYAAIDSTELAIKHFQSYQVLITDTTLINSIELEIKKLKTK